MAETMRGGALEIVPGGAADDDLALDDKHAGDALSPAEDERFVDGRVERHPRHLVRHHIRCRRHSTGALRDRLAKPGDHLGDIAVA